MELLAVVDALEQLPPLDARFYVDASYILYGTNKKNVAAQDMLRRSNRPLWLRFTKVMRRRLVLGLHTYFVKCSSHGKRGKAQHPSIDLWNDRADTCAGNFATKGPFIHDWWPEGSLVTMFCTGGRPYGATSGSKSGRNSKRNTSPRIS